MKTPTGYLQGYNAQFAVTEDQVIVGVDLTNQAADAPHLAPMLDDVVDNLSVAGAQDSVSVVLADAGYFSHDNVALDRDVDVIVAPGTRRNIQEAVTTRVPITHPTAKDEQRWQLVRFVRRWDERHRANVIEGLDAGVITRSEAAEMLLTTVHTVNWLRYRLRKTGKLAPLRWRGRPPPRMSVRQQMLERFAQPEVAELYRMRAQTVEPVIGQIKEVDGLRRFLRRGLPACTTDLMLQAAAHNLKKLWRHIRSTRASMPPSLQFA
jgi:hypothetical protein